MNGPALEAAAQAMCDRVNGQGDYGENIGQRRTGWLAQARAGVAAYLAALDTPKPPAGGDAIPAGWGETLRQSAAKHAVVCAKLANETPVVGEPDPLWWERQSAIREAAVILAHVGALPTPKPPAGGDAGAVEREVAAKIADDLASIAHRGKAHPHPLPIDTNEAWRRIEDACRDIAEAIRALPALALPAPVVEGDVEKEARFLCDRLAEFEREITDDDQFTQFNGHVAPSAARLRAALSEGRSHG